MLSTASILTARRNACLRNEPFVSCARKAIEWQREIDQLNSLYLFVALPNFCKKFFIFCRSMRRQLGSFFSTIMSLHSRNIDNAVTNSFQNFLANTRAVYGTKTYLDNYQLSTFEPSDFWCWFQNVRCSQDFRFLRSSFLFTPTNVNYADFVKAGFPTASLYPFRLFGVEGITSSTSPNRQYFDATANGAFLQFSITYAIVTVRRPWFDASVFNLYPLGVRNVRVGNWSDANYKGEFPWYVTKMIVVKDIYITSVNRVWDTTFVQMMESIRTNPTLKGNFGPFTFSSERTKYGANSFVFNRLSRMLYIRGPQIVGYVVTKLPRFCNNVFY